MRMGKDGTTMKTSAKSVMTRSGMPPRKPAAKPGEDADERGEEGDEETPMKSEFCVA